MSDTFILQNQDQLYFTRQGDWVDGRDATALYHTTHKDEALNQKLELTVRSPELRISVVNCNLDSKGRPQLAADANARQDATDRPGPGSLEPDTRTQHQSDGYRSGNL